MKRKLRGNLLGKIQAKISTDYRKDNPFIAEFQLTIWTTMKNKIDLHRIYPEKFLLGF